MTTTELRLLYFFDPFCGWCYASAPALRFLAETYPRGLKMMPSGMFADEGAQPMTRELAEYAWSNDQRIAALTGQVFSDAYRAKILHGEGVRFDSGPATRAMTALAAIDLALEPAFLEAAQLARYVEAKDTARPEVLAPIAALVAKKAGIALDEAAFARMVADSPTLVETTARRIGVAASALQNLPSPGVPQLVLSTGGRAAVLGGQDLHGGPEALRARIEAFRAG